MKASLLWLALLGASAVYAAPIPIQILSGTLTYPAGDSGGAFGRTTQFNVITTTGSINGTIQIRPDFAQTFIQLPFTVNPTMLIQGNFADLTLVDGATSQHMRTADAGNYDFQANSGFFSTERPALTAGNLTITVPFTAYLGIGWQYHANMPVLPDYSVTGSGTATFRYSQGTSPYYSFEGATFNFETPEPGSAMLAGLGLAAVLARRRLAPLLALAVGIAGLRRAGYRSKSRPAR